MYKEWPKWVKVNQDRVEIMDFMRDNSKRVWLRLASSITVPDYVKQEVVLDADDLRKLAATEFADPAARMYPVNSPGNTWLSAMYFHVCPPALKQASLKYISDSIKSAAEIYGISKDIDRAKGELEASQEKAASASDEDLYGWIVKDEAGNVTAKRYCIADIKGVEKAASYFDQNRFKYPFGVRRTISQFIVKKASQHGVALDKLPGCVLRESGYGIPHLSNLVDEIERRSLLCKDADVKMVFNNLGTLIEVTPGDELLQCLDKLAETIDHFDHIVGLDQQYGKGILSPSDLIYSVSLPEASDELDCAVKLAAYVFDVRKLAGLGKQAFAVMGTEFQTAVSDSQGSVDPVKLRHELEKLSSRDKHILESELKSI